MKIVRLSALRIGRLYLHRKYSWYSFLLETPSGIEPATLWLNQLHHRVPLHFHTGTRLYKQSWREETVTVRWRIAHFATWFCGRRDTEYEQVLSILKSAVSSTWRRFIAKQKCAGKEIKRHSHSVYNIYTFISLAG
jgi:hypothetical protein